MARQKKEVKQKSIEETLWDSATKLRGSVEPAEYSSTKPTAIGDARFTSFQARHGGGISP
ncbi:hypothetical protein K8S19_01315 [bacterium]|nr:hypothetical protein [bacterium]